MERGLLRENFLNAMLALQNHSVSVIIPAYNVSGFIADTLDSVFAQTWADFEVLVVNDGSPDTEDLELALTRFAHRIRYIVQKNAGPSAARNLGIQMAKGEWVAFLDADDLWDPTFLQSQMELAGANGFDLVYCNMRYFGEGLLPGATYMDNNPSAGPVDLTALLGESCNVLTSTVVARREAVIATGKFNTSLVHSEDFDLWLRLLMAGHKLGYQTQVLGSRRIHPQALTSDSVKSFEGILRVYGNVAASPSFPPSLMPLLDRRTAYYKNELAWARSCRLLANGETDQALPLLRTVRPPTGGRRRSFYLLLCYLGPVGAWLIHAEARLRRSRTSSPPNPHSPSGHASERAGSSSEKAGPRRVLLMGYYGAHNLGDELMLFCLREWLSRQQAAPTVVSEYPEEIRRRYGLPVVQTPVLLAGFWRGSLVRSKARSFYAALRRHDGLLIGGGDLIRDDMRWPAFFFTVEKIVFARLFRRPVFLVNIGIGKPTRSASRAILNWCLGRCERIIVRDRRSLAVCEAAGAGGRTVLAPDIVLSLAGWSGTPDKSAGGLPASNLPCLDGGGQLLLVCLRTSSDEFGRYSLNPVRLRNLAQQIEETAGRLGLEIAFLPFQTGAGEDDNTIHSQAASFMSPSARIRFVDWKAFEYGALLAVFRQARLVVAMRLHAAVLAAAAEVPFVSMPYDHKVTEFTRDYPQVPELSAENCDSPADLVRVFDSALAAAPPRPPDTWAIWKELRLFGDPAAAPEQARRPPARL